MTTEASFGSPPEPPSYAAQHPSFLPPAPHHVMEYPPDPYPPSGYPSASHPSGEYQLAGYPPASHQAAAYSQEYEAAGYPPATYHPAAYQQADHQLADGYPAADPPGGPFSTSAGPYATPAASYEPPAASYEPPAASFLATPEPHHQSAEGYRQPDAGFATTPYQSASAMPSAFAAGPSAAPDSAFATRSAPAPASVLVPSGEQPAGPSAFQSVEPFPVAPPFQDAPPFQGAQGSQGVQETQPPPAAPPFAAPPPGAAPPFGGTPFATTGEALPAYAPTTGGYPAPYGAPGQAQPPATGFEFAPTTKAPGVVLIALTTMLSIVIGLIVTYYRSRKASELGHPTKKYWVTFWVTLPLAFILGFTLRFVVFGTPDMSPTALEQKIVAEGGFVDGTEELTANKALCAAESVDSSGYGRYQCQITFTNGKHSSTAVIVDRNGNWVLG